MGDKNRIASTLHELGRLAQNQGDYGEAERLFWQSLEIKKKLGNKNGVAFTLGQMGQFYREQGQMKEALNCSLSSLAICEELHLPNRYLALKDIASIRDAVGNEQFETWLRELSNEAERISELLDQNNADEQRASKFVEWLSGIAQAVVAARKQGDAEQRAELTGQIAQAEAEAREEGAEEEEEFLAALRGLLAGEDVAERIAALSEPFKGIAEQARAERESGEQDGRVFCRR